MVAGAEWTVTNDTSFGQHQTTCHSLRRGREGKEEDRRRRSYSFLNRKKRICQVLLAGWGDRLPAERYSGWRMVQCWCSGYGQHRKIALRCFFFFFVDVTIFFSFFFCFPPFSSILMRLSQSADGEPVLVTAGLSQIGWHQSCPQRIGIRSTIVLSLRRFLPTFLSGPVE